MRCKTALLGGLLSLAVGSAGCGGSDFSAAPLAPSPPQPQAAGNTPGPGTWPSADYTLKGVSLSGVVYELTAAGRTPIAGAIVYCELCGEETHTFATANDDGFYHFSGDLATGGGVWLSPGVSTPISVGYYNKDYEDPPGLPATRQGPGWREVMIDGDTTFDIELIRRVASTP